MSRFQLGSMASSDALNAVEFKGVCVLGGGGGGGGVHGVNELCPNIKDTSIA